MVSWCWGDVAVQVGACARGRWQACGCMGVGCVFCKVGVVGGLARGWWLALGVGVCYNGGYEYVR